MTEHDPEDPSPPREGARPPSRRRRWLWVLAILAPLVVIAIAIGAAVPRPLSGSDEACVSCHVQADSEVHRSAHEEIACNACHADDPGQNFETWLAATLPGGDDTAPHGETLRERCVECHTSDDFEPWHMASTAGHRAHVLEIDEPLECAECHTWEQHATEPKPEACADCHDDVQVFTHQLDEMQCLSCHNYLASVGGGKQTPSVECRRCHGGSQEPFVTRRFANVIEGETISPAMIHGNLETCSLCHSPHPETPEARNSGEECSRCHGTVEEEMHARQDPGEFDCSTCHSAHSPRAGLVETCADCHDQTVATDTLAAAHETCGECHEAHEFTASIDDCRACHDEQQALLAAWEPPEEHGDCSSCHEPHTTRQESQTCSSCHRQATARHDECATCHEPHASAEAVQECGECHEAMRRQVRATSAHRRDGCETCHTLHSNQRASNQCRQCHADEVRLTSRANIQQHEFCSSCHTDHRFLASVDACRSCHEIPQSGPHTETCNQCHQTHGQPMGRASQCSNCHQDVGRPRGAHADCSSCHQQAHGPGVTSSACYNCHQEQERATRGWRIATHQSCGNCHENHAPTQPTACASCHSTQARGVTRSAHECASCHDTHAPPRGLWNTCQNCHSQIVQAVRPRGATHSDCQSCHQPHQVRTPSCTSCHDSLPGLHGIAQHSQCNTCHDTHALTRSTRAECTSCHTAQRRGHFPDAQTCVGCHLFE